MNDEKLNATERLRQLLDARGVEHIDYEGSATWWSDGNVECAYIQSMSDGFGQLCFMATPEQAVEATLGRGTCDMEFTQAAQFGDPNDVDSIFEVGMFRCTACGTETYGMWNDNDECREWPRYCPSCGRRVES